MMEQQPGLIFFNPLPTPGSCYFCREPVGNSPFSSACSTCLEPDRPALSPNEPEYACAECGARLPPDQLYVSLSGKTSLCSVCWEVDAAHRSIAAAARVLEGFLDILSEMRRRRILEVALNERRISCKG